MPDRRAPWSWISVWTLIASNLVPLYGVLAHGWAVFPIMLLFWLENVVIGALNVVRMLVARSPDAPGGAKLFMIPFFTVHYGIFTLVHGIFVFVLFSGGAMDGPASPPALVEGVWDAVVTWNLEWGLLALTASHVVSFVTNFIGRGEYRRRSVGALMFAPYGRVVVLHLAILGGGFLAMSLGAPTSALVILILLKIVVDLGAHVIEHRQPT